MRVSFKKASVAVLSGLIVIGVLMIYYARVIKKQIGSMFVNGPQFYPILLASIMIICCVISIWDTLRKEDKIIELPNIKIPMVLLCLTIIWVLLWQKFGYFYLISSIFVGIMLFYLNPASMGPKKLFNTILFDGIIIASVYLIFDAGLKTAL